MTVLRHRAIVSFGMQGWWLQGQDDAVHGWRTFDLNGD